MSSSINNKRRPANAGSGGKGRRPIKLTPRRKTVIDPHMISLVYFLIASRIVREAEQDEAAAAPVVSADEAAPGLDGSQGRS